MPLDRVSSVLQAQVAELEAKGTAKGAEKVVVAVRPPEGERGRPRSETSRSCGARTTRAT